MPRQEYEVVIGLEVHCQLRCKTKMFSDCGFAFGATPNSQTDPYSLGLPGTLPVPNRRAVEYAVMLALALGCEIQLHSRWARKHYFYPDLPKGYQITQSDDPYALRGQVEFADPNVPEAGEGETRTISLTRIHMEEDAGKNQHLEGDVVSLVDFNRAGAALVEIVSEPELRSAREAAAYLRELRAIIRSLGISDANMEEGTLRCDANVSLRRAGQDSLGTRCEIKNLNSFKFLEAAINAEIRRQVDVLDAGQEVIQGTMAYEVESDRTWMMRSKEEAADYRYFPEPDMPPLVLEESWVDQIRASLPELPRARHARHVEAGLNARDAAILTADPDLSAYFDRAQRDGVPAKRLYNWVTGSLLGQLNRDSLGIEDSPVLPEQLAGLVALVEDGRISGAAGKTVFQMMYEEGLSAERIVEREGLGQISDRAALERVVAEVFSEHPEQVAQFKGGKAKVRGFLYGKCMARTGRQADPAVLNLVLDEMLGQP
jgi:aspartyl-tRNA(Asn)/glutamyl-tRNA(Gln) amidotransferase subunit B